MAESAQERALRNYRKRLRQRGMARFEVLGLPADRNLIRSLARRLAEDGPGAKRLRSSLNRTLDGEHKRKGGVLAALLRAPAALADVEFGRPPMRERKLDL